MYRKLFYIQFFLLFFTSYSLAQEPADTKWKHFVPLKKVFESVTFFQGDDQGDFINDFVLILNDGSAWKVHPDDQNKLNQWKVHDTVHVCARTDHYFFKRQHKFALYNHSLDEPIRVMLVQYPMNSLLVIDAQIENCSTDFMPHTYTDPYGKTHTYHALKSEYEKKLTLSDGSVWVIKKKKRFKNFCVGDTVMVGVNAGKDSSSYFLISGIQRDAVWTWAEKR